MTARLPTRSRPTSAGTPGSRRRGAAGRLRSWPKPEKTLYLAQSGEEKVEGVAARFADVFRKDTPPGVREHYKSHPDEKHATVFHPAALTAFRAVFEPPPAK